MGFLSPSRLRTRLVLIALSAMLPAMAVIGYSQRSERRSAADRALEDSLRLARAAANQQASAFSGVQRLLLTLAQFAPLRSADPRECNELLPNILRDHPGYVNLLVANASDRTVFCAARPLDPNVPR